MQEQRGAGLGSSSGHNGGWNIRERNSSYNFME